MTLFEYAAGGAEVYLAILIVTFAAHAALVGFVVGAAAWATVRALRGGDDPVAHAARDWLPFGLGAAITAGVAPLLLIQVLYQHRMYTATLLLSHRFMAIVPVLIGGFYLLYLGKTRRAAGWGRMARAAVFGAALLSFLFVAWTWVEEHTLAAAAPDAWVAHYRDRTLVHRDPAIAPRLVAWLGLAAAAFALGAMWLARARLADRDLRRLGVVGIAGLAVAAAGAIAAGIAMPGPVPHPASPWLALGAVAHAIAALGFAALIAGRARLARGVVTGAMSVLWLAIAAVREGHRVHRIEPRPTLDDAQGLGMFVLFALLSVGAIVWLGRLVRRHLDERTEI